MQPLDAYAIGELKAIYHCLHACLPDQPALMDSALLQDLHRHLQQRATADGVDVSTHGEWARWLAER